MSSPAKRHYQRMTAAHEAAASQETKSPHGETHNLMLAKLFEDTRRLKSVESIKAKGQLKAELLPEYAPYVEGTLSADAGGHDDIIMTVMLWHIDAGVIDHSHYDQALTIGDYALRHELPMPDKYQRSTACVIAEEIADAAIAGPGMATELLLRTEGLTKSHDMPDQVRGKLHKALGLAQLENDPKRALEHLQRAHSYNPRSGVKTQIKQLEKQLKDSAGDDTTEPSV